MKQEISKSTKVLSILMAILILVLSMPVSAFASAIEEIVGSQAVDSAEQNSDEGVKGENEVFVIGEDENLREENIKHFKLSDGTTKAVVYSNAVHYKDSDGKWIDIDNALTLNGNEYSANNKSEIKFANKSGSNGLVSIKDGEYKISFSPINTNKVTVEIENPQKTDSRKFEDVSKLNDLVSKAIYKNIYDGIDIEYILVGNNVKENIIVNEKKDSYTFSFELELSKLKAELVNNEIILSDYDSGNAVYKIPSPYMLDASGEYSQSVEYSLTQSSKWKYTFTVTANAQWINSEERVFPVTVDPMVDFGGESINSYYLDNGEIKTNSTLAAGAGFATYIELSNMSNFPNNIYVTSAILELNSRTSYGENYVGAYIDNATTPIDYNYIGLYEAKKCTWDISKAFRAWRNSNYTEYKIRLEPINENSNKTYYYSTNSGIATKHPKIVISYVDMKGLEAYWSYASQNVGHAGNGHINLYTGNLVFSINTLTTTDSLFSFTPTMVYNSSLAGKGYNGTNTLSIYDNSYMAKGFKLNINESIRHVTYSQEERVVWADSDGTEHYFSQSTENENVYYDQDGLLYTLIFNENEYWLIDSNWNIRIFSQMGTNDKYYLSAIQDKSGNLLRFNFDDSNRPTYVKIKPIGSNSEISMLTFEYNEDNVLYSVRNVESGKAIVIRHSESPMGALSSTKGTYLREILYLTCASDITKEDLKAFIGDTDNIATGITVDGIMKYNYDSTGKLVEACDGLTDYSVLYMYTSNQVTELLEVGKNDSEGKTLGISYQVGYTEVKNAGSDDIYGTADDLINVYTFDNSGRTTSTYTTNLAHSEVYGAVSGEYESENEKAANSLKLSTVMKGTGSNYLKNGNFEKSDSSMYYWSMSSNASFSVSNSGTAWNNGKIILYPSVSETAYIAQSVSLTKGTYTMSLDINAYASSNLTICLKAVSATNTYIENVPLNQVYASGSHSFAYFTFEVTETTQTNYVVGVYVSDTDGAESAESVTVDNIVLSKTTGASIYNYVNNGNLEQNNATGAQGDIGSWTLPTGANITSEFVNSPFEKSLKIVGSIESVKVASQTIYTATSEALSRYANNGGGDTDEDLVFVISGFAKAPRAMPNANSSFAIRFDITYRTIGEDFKTEQTYVKFAPDKYNWQYSSASFTLPAKSMVKDISIHCEYSNNIETAYFDNITVICDKTIQPAKHYYHDDGRLKATVKGALDVTYYAYENGNNIDIITRKDRKTFEYDSYNRVITARYYKHNVFPVYTDTYDNIKASLENKQRLQTTTNYVYDNKGFLIKETTYDANNQSYIETTYVYDTEEASRTYGVLEEVRDSLGKKTLYFYDSKSGNPIATIESDNKGYYYTYNSIGNLIYVRPAEYKAETEGGAPILQQVLTSARVNYSYNSNNLLEKIIANGTTYTFSYDSFGNQSSVSIGNGVLVSQETNDYNGKVSKVIYANGTQLEYEYDNLDRVTELKYTKGSNSVVYNYEYDSNGNLCKYVDGLNNTTTVYKYDNSGKLMKMIEYDNDENLNLYSTSYSYDDESRLNWIYHNQDYQYNNNYTANNATSYYFDYNTVDGTLHSLSVDIGTTPLYEIDYAYDEFLRVENKSTLFGNIILESSYSYLSNETNSNATSVIVSSFANEISDLYGLIEENTFNYIYDENNKNIVEITDKNGSRIAEYFYDSLDRLTGEYNYELSKAYFYTYDDSGNILTESVYTLFVDGNTSWLEPLYSRYYTYKSSGWKDQLLSYRGNSITYDEMGNPLNYRDGMTFVWSNVNNLSNISYGNKSLSFTYNDQGIRTSKTVNGVTHVYTLDGTKILSEAYSDYLMLYFYDKTGSPIGLAYRQSNYDEGVFDKYYFTKNLQGDIIGIYEEDGNCIAKYTYNAWGEATVEIVYSPLGYIAINNPFRYRGYYYDTETGFYYLNARYYDPQIKRFISPDTLDNLGANGDLNSCNLYAYCSNNPVMYVDPTGEIAWEIVLLVAFLIAATVNDVYEITNGEVDYEVSDDGETVTIQNSYNIITPWVEYGYSFYLNHIESDTKDVIKGSTFGVYYEWAIHNLACDVGIALDIETLEKPGRHLSVGATVFNDYDGKFDKNNARDWFSILMSLEYLFFGTPAIIDYHIYKGGIK